MSQRLNADETLPTQLLFSQGNEEEETFHQKELIQLLPYGVSLTTDVQRPFLLLKDHNHKFTLPVALSPLEAGITLGQSSRQAVPTSPHRFLQLLLENLQIKAVQAVFVQIKGAHQYLRIYLSGHPSTNSIKVRADEAMSMCLHLGIPIYATESFINKSRYLNAQVEAMTQNMSRAQKVTTRTQSFH